MFYFDFDYVWFRFLSPCLCEWIDPYLFLMINMRWIQILSENFWVFVLVGFLDKCLFLDDFWPITTCQIKPTLAFICEFFVQASIHFDFGSEFCITLDACSLFCDCFDYSLHFTLNLC